MVETINIDALLDSPGVDCVLDVRSPSEYKHACLPGALSMPLLDDEGRHQVGLCYKTEGREAAIKLGLDLVGPRMRSFIEFAEQAAPNKRVAVYCWRGGMRSSSVAWLLSTYGFEVRVLRGGYKSFRRRMISELEKPRKLVVLGGTTGSAKTAMLMEFARQSEAVIDLEGLANHRGSAFGWIGQADQPSQEHFENTLGLCLRSFPQDATIWVEDESRKIGKLTLPMVFWQSMCEADVYVLDIPAEIRLDNLMHDYGSADVQDLREALLRIQQRLGPERLSRALDALDRSAIRDCARECLEYYDRYYHRSIQARKAEQCVFCPSTTASLQENAQIVLDLYRQKKRPLSN